MNSRTNMLPVLAAVGTALLVLVACTPDRDPATLFAPEAVGVLVVDAVLVVDQPLPSVRLTRTQAPDAVFDPRTAVVAEASIVLRSEGQDYAYEYVPSNERTAGFYRPAMSPVPVVRPNTSYVVTATTAQGETLTASTLTPGHFNIEQWTLRSNDGQTFLRNLKTFAAEGDDVYFHPDNRLTYPEGLVDGLFDGAAARAAGAMGFQISLFSLDSEAGLVIDPPFLDEEDLADLPRSGSSPALNGEDGFIRLPWFSIYYDGRHLYKVFAVDRNWFDLLRSLPTGGGGFGGNIGDGTDPPIFHVTGGIGLFGSGSVDSLGFLIAPLE